MKKKIALQIGLRLMRFSILITITFVSYLTSNCQTVKNYASEDRQKLYEIAEKWERYWNSHNMDSMGTLLRDDIDFINVGGNWLKGKAQVVQSHKILHQNVKFKTSVLKTDSVAIIYVKSDLAIMHIGTGISGDFENDGTPRPPRHVIGTWVVIKENNEWLLHTVQNGNITAVKPTK